MAEDGAYRRLLDSYYSTGTPLPLDQERLYRIARASEEKERQAVDFVISRFFELRDDGYHNARADRELVARAEHHKRLSDGARKTNVKRWGNDRQVSRSATQQAIPSAVARPQPQPREEEKKISCAPENGARKEGSPEFLKFWDSYPRKESRKGALAVWNRLDLDGQLAAILSGLEEWKKARDPQYMPYAQGWLNRESWKEKPLARGKENGTRQASRVDERREKQQEINKVILGNRSGLADALHPNVEGGAVRRNYPALPGDVEGHSA
jgi:uncharacterized protein YdaU (DUF1376 family)